MSYGGRNVREKKTAFTFWKAEMDLQELGELELIDSGTKSYVVISSF